MKVLTVAWSIYDKRINEFTRNYTGVGVVIKNLAEKLGNYVESYLLIGKNELPQMQLGNINIIKTNYEFDVDNINFSENEIHLQRMTRAFEIALENINPDIVNFHSSGDLTIRCMKICIEKNILYTYTDHLFIELNKTFGKYEKYVEWEKIILNIPNLNIIAVSSGMKKKILKEFPRICDKNIKVITNGTDFIATLKNDSILKKYSIIDHKVLLCVGTISERKNQRQVVKAFQVLPREIRNSLKILFCGSDGLNGVLQEDIRNAGEQNKLIYVGAIDSEEMKKYYSIADGLLLPSHTEGLSIAALEAIAYGIPVIMFSDLECVDDLRDEQVICLAEERTNQCLAQSIIQWYEKNWNSDYIKKYAEAFSMEKMAENYINYYAYLLSKEK